MSFEDLLDGKCAIYHMISNSKSVGYGIQTNQFAYPPEPDLDEIPCHFKVEEGTLDQTDTANVFTYRGKLNLPSGTDVRVNDKIVDKSNGLTYTAEIPRDVRGHHMIVMISRSGLVKGAL